MGEVPMRDVLRALGGWPVVNDSWKEDTWNFEVIVAKLRGLYNAPILIDSWVAADDKNSSVHILQVFIFNVIVHAIYLLQIVAKGWCAVSPSISGLVI